MERSMVWIVGCNGMLGTELCSVLARAGIDFVGSGRPVDIRNFGMLEDFARGKRVSAVVNCAAYTAVDKAESEREAARQLNEDGARNIARLTKKIGASLIHISTDYVFDGTQDTPRSERDDISPLGVYGTTKAAGEKAVQEECDDFYILRTAWLYGWAGKNFVYTILRAMNKNPCVTVVDDQKGTPTNCTTLSDVISTIIQRKNKACPIPSGIYHVTDDGETSWFDFAVEIKKIGCETGLLSNKECAVLPCSTEEYKTAAKRPAYSVLSKEKIKRALGIALPEWRESLRSFMTSPHFDKTRIEL